MPIDPVASGAPAPGLSSPPVPDAPPPAANQATSAPASPTPPSSPPPQKDLFETKTGGGDVKLFEKKGDIGKKEVKKEVEKKGGDEVPKAKKPTGPTATVINGSAKAEVGDKVGPGASATGKFDVGVSNAGLDVNGSVKLDAHLLNLTGKAEKSFEFEYGGEKFKATLALQGDLKIGGDANLKVNFHVGTDGAVSLNLGADGFVGAKGELKGTLKLESKPKDAPDGAYQPLMEGNASVSAYAGAAAGAKFNVNGDIKSGKIGFEAKAFASAGVGAGFGVDGSINAKNIADVAGRVGVKFLKDAGNAVNLPGATMDYWNASSQAAELDKRAAPFTQKAHAIDAWNRQGYNGLMPSQQLSKAIGALNYYKNYDMVDTAAGIGSKDGIIAREDLEAAFRNESFPDEVRAAAYHLAQPGVWDRIHSDGFLSKADGQNPFKRAISPETKAAFQNDDRVETARRDMVQRSTDLQRRFGMMAMDYTNARSPEDLKALLGKIDAELGNSQQWGGVKNVQGGNGHDAVAHESGLRWLRQQVEEQLKLKKAG